MRHYDINCQPVCLFQYTLFRKKKKHIQRNTQSQSIVKQTSYDFVTDHISQLLYFFDKKAKNRICLVQHQQKKNNVNNSLYSHDQKFQRYHEYCDEPTNYHVPIICMMFYIVHYLLLSWRDSLIDMSNCLDVHICNNRHVIGKITKKTGFTIALKQLIYILNKFLSRVFLLVPIQSSINKFNRMEIKSF